MTKGDLGKILQVLSEGMEAGDVSAWNGLVGGPWWLNSRGAGKFHSF